MVTLCTKVVNAPIMKVQGLYSKVTAKAKLLSSAGQTMGVSNKAQTA